jgi:predicted phosphodiesterase
MKKLLILADIHQKNFILSDLDKFFHKNKVNGVLVLGDLTDRNEESIDYAHRFYSLIKKNKLDFLYIHGNNEPQSVIDFFNKMKCTIHNLPKLYGGLRFVGIGGWGDDIKLETLNNIKGSFFVTHVPPVKRSYKGNIKNAPLIHAFGHSHKNEYFIKENNIFYLSLKSAGYFRRGAIVSIPDLKVEFISI